MDEQAERIMEAVKDWEANPQDYTMQDWEDMFEDRDPFEFIQDGPSGCALRYHFVIKLIKENP